MHLINPDLVEGIKLGLAIIFNAWKPLLNFVKKVVSAVTQKSRRR